jgi:imidazolonepropionase-like amidohydrolase
MKWPHKPHLPEMLGQQQSADRLVRVGDVTALILLNCPNRESAARATPSFVHVAARSARIWVLSRLLLVLVCHVHAAPRLSAQTRLSSQDGLLVLRHVTVIDATGAPAQPDMTVVINRGRIVDLGKTTEVSVPRNAHVVDETGKFLIPGLWDMHVHTSWDRRFVLPLLVANGIVGVRDMSDSDWVALQECRRDIMEGKLLGPSIYAAGRILDGLPEPWRGWIRVSNAAQGRAAVDEIRRSGADFVKVYSFLSRDAYFAIADEAKRQGIPMVGHAPEAVSEAEVSDAGQKSVEHLTGVLLASSTKEAELRKPLVQAINHPGSPDPYKSFSLEKALIDTFSAEKAAALFARNAKNGTWQVPTLVNLQNGRFVGDPGYRQKFFYNSPHMRYVSYPLKMTWGLAMRAGENRTPSETAINAQLFARELAVVGQMHRAGIGILAGTDTPHPFVYPGFSLHQELELLVEAGMTPMEALQAATRSPAVFLGILDSMGTVEKGKIADLVLLDANPLEDIRNSQKINALVLNGMLISRARLDALLVGAESSRWYPNPAAIRFLRKALLHRMRKLLYMALAILLAMSLGLYYFRKRHRAMTLRLGGANSDSPSPLLLRV